MKASLQYPQFLIKDAFMIFREAISACVQLRIATDSKLHQHIGFLTQYFSTATPSQHNSRQLLEQ